MKGIRLMKCPECGSDSLTKFGKKFVWRGEKREKVQQYQCRDCGRITINPVVKEAKIVPLG